ncbi:MAG: methylated-DNA--[protein]-cysteine S-methyltransferase [Rhizobiales bacterium]|nr:methylated-DNA--[protein]-cysteine S-methyltransferase [Hyphomicrobiales bacterium]
MLTMATSTERKLPTIPNDDALWDAVKRRERLVDGVFYYSVRLASLARTKAGPLGIGRGRLKADVLTKRQARRTRWAAVDAGRANETTLVARREPAAMIRFALGECSLGSILVAATERGVCTIEFGDEPDTLMRNLRDRFSPARLAGGDATFERLAAKAIAVIEAPAGGLDLPLDPHGTAFQQSVWQALRLIAPGSTASYAEIAARIGRPKAVRAVARACASNTIAVAIPCHRVVRSDAAVSGYRWGVRRKRALLAREQTA